MRRVVVDMQNALFADAIATALQKFDSDFDVCQSLTKPRIYAFLPRRIF